jgi:predicted nucleotidyltransferase
MPTALELSREDWQPYIQAATRRASSEEPVGDERLRQAEHLRQMEHLRQALLRQVREAADMLRQQFGVQRVVLFGSLAREEWFTADSDVDLAVEGLTPERYWEAWRSVEELISDVPVDFVEIETARPSLRRAILRYGIEV